MDWNNNGKEDVFDSFMDHMLANNKFDEDENSDDDEDEE